MTQRRTTTTVMWVSWLMLSLCVLWAAVA